MGYVDGRYLCHASRACAVAPRFAVARLRGARYDLGQMISSGRRTYFAGGGCQGLYEPKFHKWPSTSRHE